MDNNIENFKDEFLHLYFDEEDLQEHIDEKIIELENIGDDVTLYRIVFLNNEKELDINNLGNHWVEDLSTLDANMLNYLKYECNGETIEGEPYLIEAKFKNSSIDKEVSLNQYLYNPNEQEIFIKDNEKPISDFIFRHYKTFDIIDLISIVDKKMSELEQAKSALKEMNDLINKQIKKGLLKNEGFNDGFSEQYSCKGLTIVKVLKNNNNLESTVFYDGDEEFATIYSTGKTSLDNEFVDEVEKVLEVHNDVMPKLKLFDTTNEIIAKSESINTVKFKKNSRKV